jgi:hypothetical protein
VRWLAISRNPGVGLSACDRSRDVFILYVHEPSPLQCELFLAALDELAGEQHIMNEVIEIDLEELGWGD